MQLRITWEQGSATYETTDRVVVGRGPDATVFVDGEMVSRSHVLFAFVNNAWTFQDGSSNGTYINGSPVLNGAITSAVTMTLGAVDGPTLTADLVAIPASEVPSPPPPPPAPAVGAAVPPPPPAPVVETPLEETPAPPSPSMEMPMVETPDMPAAPAVPSPPEMPEAPAPNMPAAAERATAPIPVTPPAPASPAPPPAAALPPNPSAAQIGGAAVPAAPAIPSQAAVSAQSIVDSAVGRNTVRLDDQALRLELDGVTRAFDPGQRIVLGRDPSCDMQTDSQLVSARHCEFTHDGTNWWVQDLASTRGTWIDHKQITKAKLEGALFVLMGDDDAGVPVRVVTAGVHRKPKDRRPLFLAGAALAAVIVGGIAAVLFWPNGSDNDEQIAQLQEQIEEQRRQTDEQIAAAEAQAAQAIAEANEAGGAGNSPAELSAARLSTAFVSVPDEFGNVIGTGSGALISDDGLILTNIHVVLPGLEFERTGDPTFAGLTDPQEVLVAFPSTDGGPADLFFIAEQFDAHPAHDAALIQIVEGLDGATFDDLPEPLSIGDSGALLAGDEIAVVGYPGTAFTERVSVALSNFQSFQPCVAGSSFDDSWGCLRDYDEGYLNLAGETLEGGSSGGPIIRGGEVVGIQLGIFETGESTAQNLGVPVDLIAEELDVG